MTGPTFQVVGHINTLQTLPYIAESTLQSDTAEENFYQQLNHKRKCSRYIYTLTITVYSGTSENGFHLLWVSITFHYCYVSRKEGIFVTEDHTLLGSPKYTSLTQNEIELFAQVGIVGYEDTDILLYSQLLLNRTNRVVSAEECSKATKRNDSCISVVNCEQCRYGLLKKLFVLRQSQQSKFYSLVMFLRATSLGLCEDHITHAALNQHILAFQPPRYAMSFSV